MIAVQNSTTTKGIVMYTKFQDRLLRAVENLAPEAGYTLEAEPYETAVGAVWLRIKLVGEIDQAFMTFGPRGGLIYSSGFFSAFHTPTKKTARHQARYLVRQLRLDAALRAGRRGTVK